MLASMLRNAPSQGSCGQCDFMPGYYLELAQKHEPGCRADPQAPVPLWQVTNAVPGTEGTALSFTQTGATSSGWRWTQVSKAVGRQVWQRKAYAAISTGSEKTIKPNIAGLWDRGWIIQHLTTAKPSVPHCLHLSPSHQHFPATLCILMLIKPALLRSWFNSLTQQECKPAIERLYRFLLAFGAFESRKEGLGST